MSKDKIKSNLGKGKQEKGSASKEDAVEVAAGGELHQIAAGEHPVLTTNQGVAISDNQNSLKANPYGPTLLEDFILREKITHFAHTGIHAYGDVDHVRSHHPAFFKDDRRLRCA
jgi:catalase